MYVSTPFRKGLWIDVKDAARTTMGLDTGCKDPPDEWKRRMLLAEHSPIRLIRYAWKWYEIPYWVSVHLVRHWLGILHFVSTQRDDRNNTPVSRADAPQGTPVTHECEANAQALISISRVRLCNKASKETREAWQAVKDNMEPIMASVMVKNCIYRGFCPEMEGCGYVHTDAYKEELLLYRGKMN